MDSIAFIDVRDVIRGIARRWLFIAVFTALCAMSSFWFVNRVTPVYSADAQVLIESQESPLTRIGQDRNDRASLTERDITSQVEVVRSRDLAIRVIKDLGLGRLAEFDPIKKGTGTVGGLMIRFGFKPDPAMMSAEQRTLIQFDKKLTVYAIPQSSVITIEFESDDPELAAKVANQIATHYVSFSKQTLNEPTGQARDWLATQIEDLRKKVVESETAVEKFRAKAGIFRGVQATLTNEELSSLNSQIILASAAHAEAKAKADSIRELLRTTGTVDTSAEVLNSSLIQRLREQQIQLTRSKAELSTIYLDNHPRIIAVDREIQDLNKQLRNEAFKVVERLEQEAKVAAVREASLKASLEAAKKESSTSSFDDVRLRELEREASANRSLLETFLVRYTDASSRQDVSSQPGLGRVISSAGEPSAASFPKKGPIMLLATIGGLMLALGLAFVVEVMSSAALADRAVNAPHMTAPVEPSIASVSASVGVPAAGIKVFDTASPQASAASSSAVLYPVTSAPPAAVAEQTAQAVLSTIPAMASTMLAIHASGKGLQDDNNSYRIALEPVAVSVASSLNNSSIRRLTVVNLTGSVLDSITLTLTLGRILALAGGKVAVVDAGTKRPGFDILEPSFSTPGLFEIVAGRAGFSEAVRKDPLSQLQVLPAGKIDGLAGDILSSAPMSNAIQALEQVYQLTIVHLGNADDRNVALAASSGAVLVVATTDKVREAGDICEALRLGRVKQAEVVCVAGLSEQRSVSRFSNIAASL